MRQEKLKEMVNWKQEREDQTGLINNKELKGTKLCYLGNYHDLIRNISGLKKDSVKANSFSCLNPDDAMRKKKKIILEADMAKKR